MRSSEPDERGQLTPAAAGAALTAGRAWWSYPTLASALGGDVARLPTLSDTLTR
jgi:hypothetical protein